MSVQLSPEDREIMAEVESRWKRQIDSVIEPLQKQVQALSQRSSRPPGYGPEHAALDMPLTQATVALSADSNFKSWLNAPRTRHSHFAGEFRFDVKAATPILNVGSPVPLPVIRGPQQPALRLGLTVPRVPMVAGSGVTYTREESFVPGADFVVEGAVKPASEFTFANHVVNFQTLATTTKVSLQAVADVPDLMPWIERRLSYSVLLREEDYILNDAAGLLALAQPLSPAYAPPAPASTLDVIGAAVAELEALGYSPDCVVMSGPDAAQTRLLKSTFGSFLWASPDSEVGVTSMWSVPVIISPKLAVGTVLVAALADSCLLFDRQSLVVEIAFQNEDDFVRNLCTLRAEERVALAVMVPGALIKGTAVPPGAQASSPQAHNTTQGIAPKK